MKKTIELAINAGIIPLNALRQLAQWKLIPDSLDLSAGEQKIEFSWNSVEEFLDFVQSLRQAQEEENATIRETELEQVGSFCTVQVCDETGYATPVQTAIEDKLGRVILPASQRRVDFKSIAINGDPWRDVVRFEPRYRGEEVVAWVLYPAKTDQKKETRDEVAVPIS